MDITKTRLQLQNELSQSGKPGVKQVKHGMVRTAYNIGILFDLFLDILLYYYSFFFVIKFRKKVTRNYL